MDNLKNENLNIIQDINDNEAKLFENRYNYTNRTRINSCEKNNFAKDCLNKYKVINLKNLKKLNQIMINL